MLHEQVEHDALALGAHRVDERLVAVAQVDGAPARCLVMRLRRPRAVGQVDADLLVERPVPVHGIADGFWVFCMGCSSRSFGWVSADDELRERGRPGSRTRRGS